MCLFMGDFGGGFVRRGRDRVLVLDDDRAILELLGEALRDEGFEVDLASSVGEARRLSAAHPPRVVLLDLRLANTPQELFLETYRVLDATGARMVVLSAAPRAVEQAAELGADAVLGKPFDLDQLVGLVRKLLGSASRGSR
jgi:DNA-binding response OmpR family regulator